MLRSSGSTGARTAGWTTAAKKKGGTGNLPNLRTSSINRITGLNQYVLLPCKPDFVPGGFPPQ